jgi:hypothetical protein
VRSTFCRVGALFDGATYTWNGAGWSKDAARAPNFALGMACTSPSYCIATRGNGSPPELADFDGTTWSTALALPSALPAFTSLPAIPACGTSCYVATPDGHVIATSH